MKDYKRIALLFCLLQKRLLKKKVFLVLLTVLPLAVLALHVTALKEDAGIVKILLYGEDGCGEAALRVMDRLLEEDSVIWYESCLSEEEAVKRIERGEAEALWIFRENFAERLKDFSEKGEGKAFVTIVSLADKKDSIFLKLAAEKLYGVIFPELSYDIYESFLEEKLPALSADEKELRDFYNATRVEESLFEFAYVNEEDATGDIEANNYLTVPVRGLLALFVLLCGLAAALLFMQDEKRKLFAGMPIKHRYLFALGYHGIAVLDGAAAAFLALALSGTFTQFFKELLLLFAYSVLTAVFCNLLRLSLKKEMLLGLFTPVLLLLCLAVCPVFFNIKKFRMVQKLLPPYYYLNALHDEIVLLQLLVFTVICTAAGFVLFKWTREA